MNVRLSRFLAVVSLVLLAACGSDSGGSGDGGNADADRYPLPNGEAYCFDDTQCTSGHCDLSSASPETNRCCASGECCDGLPNAASDCGAGNRCRVSQGVCVTGDLGTNCVENAECDDGLRCGPGGTCVARIALGATGCETFSDCVSGVCDTLSSNGPETGRCCEGPDCCDGSPSDDADCGAGSFCRGSTFSCVSGDLASSCDTSADCDAGLTCGDGLCMLGLTDGSITCDDQRDCMSGHCDLSTAGTEVGRCCESGECCDSDSDCPSNHTCLVTIDLAPHARCETRSTGAYCDTDSDCASSDHCRESSDVCVAGTAGTGCDDTSDCDVGLYCNTSNTCTSAIANGSSGCTQDVECAAGECDLEGANSGMCCQASGQGATGQCCTADAQCGIGDHCRQAAFQCVDGGIGAVCDENADCDDIDLDESGPMAPVAGSAFCGLSGNVTHLCCLGAGAVTGATGRCCASDSDCNAGDRCLEGARSCMSGASGSLCFNGSDCDSNSCNMSNNSCN